MLLTRRTVQRIGTTVAITATAFLPATGAVAQDGGTCSQEVVVDPVSNTVFIKLVCTDDDNDGGAPGTTPVGSPGGGGGASTNCRLIREGLEEQSWRGPEAEQWWLLSTYECTTGADTYESTRWECVTSCPAGVPLRGGLAPGTPAIDWTIRLDDLLAEVDQRLDLPRPATAGIWQVVDSAHPEQMAVVNAETWFWSTAFTEIVESGTDGPLEVVITATPTSLTVDPGDGSDPFVCPDGGTAYDPGQPYTQQAADGDRPSRSTCHHTYVRTSRDTDAGFLVTVTATWNVDYTYSGPISGSGSLGPDTVQDPPFALTVGEIQSYRGGS